MPVTIGNGVVVSIVVVHSGFSPVQVVAEVLCDSTIIYSLYHRNKYLMLHDVVQIVYIILGSVYLVYSSPILSQRNKTLSSLLDSSTISTYCYCM